jgi:hypothetical protein
MVSNRALWTVACRLGIGLGFLGVCNACCAVLCV